MVIAPGRLVRGTAVLRAGASMREDMEPNGRSDDADDPDEAREAAFMIALSLTKL